MSFLTVRALNVYLNVLIIQADAIMQETIAVLIHGAYRHEHLDG
ncbi:hypothetical protein [Ferrimicrobium sp.]|nr:hypothetical protein [Ferrimicrobium sp.]